MRKILLSLLVLCGATALAIATPVYAIDGTQLLEQIDRNLTPESFESYRKIINIEPNGRTKEYVYYTAKKGRDKIAGLFLSPASDRGRSTLRLGDNMWLYVPSVGKPIRITSLQSVIGGVFNNADILALDYSVEYDVEKVEDLGNEYLLYCKAKTNTVAYDKLKMWVDKSKILPTKIECLTEAEMLIKTLYFKDIKDFGEGIIRPSIIETDSPLYKGYKSVMIFAKIAKREFPDEVFTLTFMPNMLSLLK
jgi:outer membrane lipoprotein-sorting protein